MATKKELESALVEMLEYCEEYLTENMHEEFLNRKKKMVGMPNTSYNLNLHITVDQFLHPVDVDPWDGSEYEIIIKLKSTGEILHHLVQDVDFG